MGDTSKFYVHRKLYGRGFDINGTLFALQNVTVEMLSWKYSRDVLEMFSKIVLKNPCLNVLEFDVLPLL